MPQKDIKHEKYHFLYMLQNIKFLLLFSSYWNKEKEKENKIKSFIDAIDAIPEWNLFQAMAGRNKNDMASKLFRFKGAVSAQKIF